MSVAYLKRKMYCFGGVKRRARALARVRQSHQQKRVRPDRQHSYSHFPSLYNTPFSPSCPPPLSRPLCRHAGGSACSSWTHPLPSSRPSSPIPKNMFTTSQRRVKYSTPTSKHPPHRCPTLKVDAFIFSSQELCCSHVILSPETVPVRGHWQKRLRLFPGAGKRAARGSDNAFPLPRATQVCCSQSCPMA
jgi:hypothetical protein